MHEIWKILPSNEHCPYCMGYRSDRRLFLWKVRDIECKQIVLGRISSNAGKF